MSFLRRRSVVLLLTLGVLFGTPGTAHAYQENAAGHVYRSGSDCAYAHAHLDNDNAQPYLSTYASMDWLGANGWCTDTGAIAYPGTLSVSQDLLFFDTSVNQWRYCNIGAWYTNNNYYTHAITTSWAPYRPCGMRWYYLNGYARTWNGGWHTGYKQTAMVSPRYA